MMVVSACVWSLSTCRRFYRFFSRPSCLVHCMLFLQVIDKKTASYLHGIILRMLIISLRCKSLFPFLFSPSILTFSHTHAHAHAHITPSFRNSFVLFSHYPKKDRTKDHSTTDTIEHSRITTQVTTATSKLHCAGIISFSTCTASILEWIGFSHCKSFAWYIWEVTVRPKPNKNG